MPSGRGGGKAAAVVRRRQPAPSWRRVHAFVWHAFVWRVRSGKHTRRRRSRQEDGETGHARLSLCRSPNGTSVRASGVTPGAVRPKACPRRRQDGEGGGGGVDGPQPVARGCPQHAGGERLVRESMHAVTRAAACCVPGRLPRACVARPSRSARRGANRCCAAARLCRTPLPTLSCASKRGRTYQARKSANEGRGDVVFNQLTYVPTCNHMPTCAKCDEPVFMWVRGTRRRRCCACAARALLFRRRRNAEGPDATHAWHTHNACSARRRTKCAHKPQAPQSRHRPKRLCV
jgi:hypothetical protein